MGGARRTGVETGHTVGGGLLSGAPPCGPRPFRLRRLSPLRGLSPSGLRSLALAPSGRPRRSVSPPIRSGANQPP